MTDVIDLFAGPGGWSVALAGLGLVEVGVEWDATACATARANGHARVQADVSGLDPVAFAREHHWNGRGLIASPPCQSFSVAGKGGGKLDMDKLINDPSHDTWHDPRSLLALEPLRWAGALRPEWIALEEVPTVLPLWEHMATQLADYSVWTGVLDAEAYGVPQRRRRAVLLASRTREVTMPVPTHSRHGHDDGLPAPVTVRQALADIPRGRVPGARITLAKNPVVRPSPWAGMLFNGAGRVLDPDAPALTMTASMGGNRTHIVDDGSWDGPSWVVGHHARLLAGVRDTKVPASLRRLSLAEAAALQTFPADCHWAGGLSKQFQQVGNAVPPLLARHLVASLTLDTPTPDPRVLHRD